MSVLTGFVPKKLFTLENERKGGKSPFVLLMDGHYCCCLGKVSFIEGEQSVSAS
jgi:hypothetical protein